jgi:hypothetical protein
MSHEFKYVIDHFKEGQKSIQVDIDRFALSVALDVAYILNLDKKRLCELTVGDVFDGQSIRPSVIRKPDEPAIPIPNDLTEVIADYLIHRSTLKNQPTTSDSPLFPYPSGSTGEKKLQRHISQHTRYHGYPELKKEAVKYQATIIQKTGIQNEQLKEEVANKIGKTPRTADNILTGKASVPKRKIDGPAGRYLELADGIVVLPAAILLDEKEVIKIIEEAFACANGFKHKPKQDKAENFLTEYNFVNILEQRVQEVEQDIIKRRKQATQDSSTVAGRKQPYSLMDLTRDAVEQHRHNLRLEEHSSVQGDITEKADQSEEMIANDVITNKSTGASPWPADDNPFIAIKNTKQQLEPASATLLRETVSIKISSDELNEKISEVMTRVERVKAMITKDEWAQMKKALKHRPSLKTVKKSKQQEKKKKPARDSQLPPRLSKKEREALHREEYIELLNYRQEQYEGVVISNAKNIMKECGLLPAGVAEITNVKKIAEFRICDVIKPEHLPDFQTNETISPAWIVPEINALALSQDAQVAIAKHLDDLKTIFHHPSSFVDPNRMIFSKPPKLTYIKRTSTKDDKRKRANKPDKPTKATRTTYSYYTAAALTNRINKMSLLRLGGL